MSTDRAPFARKHDGPGVLIVPSPTLHYHPENRAELLASVAEIAARAQASPQPVVEARAWGSGWALSEAAVTHVHPIDTAKLNRTLTGVVPACLSAEERALLFAQPGLADPAALDVYNYFHVEAGIKLFDLYTRLDNQPDETAAVGALPGSWALPTMGGAGGQSIVGAFSTGTHGGDLDRGPITSAVAALHLVGPDAREYWIEPIPQMAPLTDAAALRRVYPGIEVVRDDALFDSVLVSVGRFGVIYSVVLKVVRQYGLRDTRLRSRWSLVRPLLEDPASELYRHRFLQVAINPHASPWLSGGEHTCFVTTRETLRLAETTDGGARGRAQRGGAMAGVGPPLRVGEAGFGDLLGALLCQAGSAAAVVDPVLRLLRGAAAVFAILAILFPPAGAVAVLLFRVADELERALAALPPGATLGDLVALLINTATRVGRPEILAIANEALLEQGQAPWSISDVSYAVMDFADYTDRNCRSRAVSLEVAFDAQTLSGSRAGFIAFVERTFARIRELGSGTLVPPPPPGAPATPTGRPLPFGGYLSLRFTGASSAILAMQRWARTCHVEVAGLGGLEGNVPFLRAVEADAVSLGGVVHWGQQHDADLAGIGYTEASFPLLGSWRDQLARTTRNGRQYWFGTPFTRQRGLEVVQPRIADFGAFRRYYCAGDGVEVWWNAEDNPPGTTLRLVMTPDAGAVTEARLGTLREADALVPLAVPPGHSRLALVAEYTLGSTRSESRAVDVFGFDGRVPGSAFQISGRAVCMEIDGAPRWGVRVVLDEAKWAPGLRPGNMRRIAGPAGGVLVRKDGVDDVLVPTATSGGGIGFLGTTEMRGTWTLFTTATGCAGSAPVLGIEVIVGCG